ncbi:MAG: 2-dehydro-3-deoxygalactonokinase [Bacteroidota bacterium]|nr:2-dehydro-3-deoxygalactonokinase [Bacteroidota bacterium]
MKAFLSCDWGTSSFRLSYVELPSLTCISAGSADKGIAKIFELWKQSGRKEEERFSFYLDIIEDHARILEQQLKFSVKGKPLIISGMASSSIGMMDIPYKEAPFLADGSDLAVKRMGDTGPGYDIFIISGVQTADDVMRGEETQLAGAIRDKKEERLYIFPGTHSKHILVKNGRAIDFKTYMTGEFFDILSKRSILSGSVREGEGLNDHRNKKSFEKGVADSVQSNILHTSFLVRTNDLFHKLTREENYYYLSGLLIGTELNEVTRPWHIKITLVINESMKPFYVTALKIAGIPESENSFKIENADEALIKGQLAIWNHSGNRVSRL